MQVYLNGADWAAYQSNNIWHTINVNGRSADKIFTFTPPGGKYGVAMHCSDSQSSKDIHITQSTATEAPIAVVGCVDNTTAPVTHTVSGSVTGIGQSNMAQIVGGTANAAFLFVDGNYALTDMEEGISDVLAYTMDTNQNLLKMLIEHDLNVSKDIYDLDFDFNNAAALIPHDFIVKGGGKSRGTAMFGSKNGNFIPIGSYDDKGHDKWRAITGQTISGDVYFFIASNGDSDTTSKTIMDYRDAVTDPGNVTFDPTKIANIGVVIGNSEPHKYVNINYTPSATSPKLQYYNIIENQDNTNISYSVRMTTGWIENLTTYVIPISKLSKLSGWKSEWNMQNNEQVKWTAIATMSNSVSKSRYTSMSLAGTVIHSATKANSYTLQ